jgi:hypothetical protein
VLNKSNLGLFVPLQKLANKTNKKTFFIIQCISLVICMAIVMYFRFNYIGLGIIVGVFLALENIVFDKSN